MNEKMKALMEILKVIAEESNLERLLNKILDGAMKITRCRAGTLYFREGECLTFRLVRNLDRRDIEKSISAFPVPINSRSHLCTLAAMDNKTISISDAYADACGDHDLSGLKEYDARTGYRTRSVLVCPINAEGGDCLAVLQLINATDAKGQICDFSDTVELVETLASSVSLKLQTVRIKSSLNKFIQVKQVLESSTVSEKLRKDTLSYMDENYCDTCSLGELERIARETNMPAHVLEAKRKKIKAGIAERAKHTAKSVDVENISQEFLENAKNQESISPHELFVSYIEASSLKCAQVGRQTGLSKTAISRMYTHETALTKKTVFRFCMGMYLRLEQSLELMRVSGYILIENDPLDSFILGWLKRNEQADWSLTPMDLEAIMVDYEKIEEIIKNTKK